MKKILLAVIITLMISGQASAVVKIRDVAKVEGIRENQIIGYGLVVGLNGTGDKNQTIFTNHTLVKMLSKKGIVVDENSVKVKNVAAVMVTAKLPPFARSGQTVDVVLSSIGDAKSLEGGTLLLTELEGPDGETYAVAQGPISVGGLNASAGGSSVTKNHPTVGRIPKGAMIERELAFAMDTSKIDLFFNNYSLSNVVNAKTAINSFIGNNLAQVTSPSNIQIRIPAEFRNNYYDFLNTVLNLEIEPETFAKVVVDERTGTIVIGSDVRISTVAVAHGNLTITVTNNIQVSQPASFSNGQTVVTEEPKIEVAEDSAKLMVVPEGVTVSDLVKALNAIGVTPRDLISILQAIDGAGALHGVLEVI